MCLTSGREGGRERERERERKKERERDRERMMTTIPQFQVLRLTSMKDMNYGKANFTGVKQVMR